VTADYPPAAGLAPPDARDALEAVRAEVGKAIIGQDQVLTGLVICLLCRGHVLLEGMPGVAKTLLVRSLAAALSLRGTRVQFTPDLMPGDVTGSLIYDAKTALFQFREGPVFTNLLLADEINRTPPKTQAALLEAMEERQVSVEGSPRTLPEPFLVAATQNPIEQEGTYPLPEAQLDRFMFMVDVGYPSAEEEVQIVRATTSGAFPELSKILAPEQIRALQELVLRVPAAEHVIRYAVEMVRRTRPRETADKQVKDHVSWGAGPRASQALILGAKARAALDGRPAATVEDVRALAEPVLRHRVLTNFHAEAEGIDSRAVIAQLLRDQRA